MNMTTVPSNQIKAMQHEIASLKEQVAQWETEYNGCSTLLNNAERTIETLEETIAQQAEAIRLKDAALEKIACIGNGDTHGNSIGNCLAIDALALQPSPEILQDRDERVAEAIAEAIGGCAYDCTRVWGAWGYGTMSETDFVPVVDQSDRITEIASAAIAAMISS